MTHEEMDGLYELYMLGALEPEQATAIDEHVQTKCAHCLDQLQDAVQVTAVMAGLAEPQTPPTRLRKRVLASVKPEAQSRAWLPWMFGLGTACAALLAIVIWSTTTMRSYRDQVVELQAQRDQLREAVEILSRSETKTVRFGVADNQAHGRVFVNTSRGLVFVGSQLPELARDRTFQLWLIPAKGAPQSAGVFRPNAAGNFVNVRTEPIDTARIQAIAVSVEPQGGSPAPTTKPILIVPLGAG
ncbi:MAG: anti-sigma factor [Acidobacteriota bacterium]|nr:anti-sigma factor [Acidobacteriota bacterium]